MIIDEKELERRLSSSRNFINKIPNKRDPVLVMPKPVKEVTPSIKSEPLRIAAGVASQYQSAAEVASQLGITEQQVTSARDTKSVTLREKISLATEKVEEIALLRTLESLNLLTPDVVSGEKPKDIANIAMNMSRVASNMRRSNISPEDSSSNVKFIVYAPTLKNETHFDIIEKAV